MTRFDLMRQGVAVGLEGRLRVEVMISPPDKRARDLDNIWKVAGDACTRAGVWQDDSQIDWLVLRRAEPVKGGRVQVSVMVIGEGPK